MYRCYNGNLYAKGTQIRQVSKIKVHPGNRVRIVLDHLQVSEKLILFFSTAHQQRNQQTVSHTIFCHTVQHTLSYTIYSADNESGKPQGVCFKVSD